MIEISIFNPHKLFSYKGSLKFKVLNMKRIFISHNHRNSDAIERIKSLNKNPNNNLNFKDKSLSGPILNQYDHVIRRPPSDTAANPVKKEIKRLLHESDKLLVLVGPDSHSSMWVDWEIKAFTSIYGSTKNILLMATQNDTRTTGPESARHLTVHAWDTKRLIEWAKR